MRDRSRRNALRLAAGMIAVASWLVLMTGTRHDDPVGLLAPFLVLAALACVRDGGVTRSLRW